MKNRLEWLKKKVLTFAVTAYTPVKELEPCMICGEPGCKTECLCGPDAGCPKCGCMDDPVTTKGMPGETLVTCPKCGFVECNFYEGAVR